MKPRLQNSGRADALTLIAPVDGLVAVLPAGYPLATASFSRRGGHLLVNAPGHPEIVVFRFFSGGSATLRTACGVRYSRAMIELRRSLSSRVERALKSLSAADREG